METFWLKFVGTTSTLSVYSDMITATTLGVDRAEIELAFLWLDPFEVEEGAGSIAWSHAMSKSLMAREQFEAEFFPFSNWRAPNGDDVLQNTDNLKTLEILIRMPRVWIAEPTTTGRELSPRYVDDVNFPLTVAMLPRAVVCDKPARSKTDEGTTEATMMIYSRGIV